eukprot:5706820-Alexandrium_andersonii.AAC.1
MSASLVGSEMCIRDRHSATHSGMPNASAATCTTPVPYALYGKSASCRSCLLYTSDAADDM